MGKEENEVKKKTNEKKKVNKTAEKKKNVKDKTKKAASKVKSAAKKVNRENVKEVLLREEMKREHKYIILGLSSLLIAFLLYIGINFVLQNMATVEATLNEIDVSEYETLSKGKEKEVVYVATKDSETNNEYQEIVVEVARKRKKKINFLDLAVVKERHQTLTFMNTLELTKDTYTDPMVVIFEDGKVKDSLLGTSTKKELKLFLDKNRID